jgi:protein dithiol:quinone oxidoreductase
MDSPVLNDTASPDHCAMKVLSRLFASPTRIALLLGLACAGLVGASFFVQHVMGIEPCPLCVIQRFTYLGLVPVFFAAAMVRADGRLQRALFWTAAFLTLSGIGVAGYQTYLQLFPPQVVARCGAGLTYMLENLSITDLLARLFQASGDCSDASFKVLGLTLAQASLIIFFSFTLFLAILLRRQT